MSLTPPRPKFLSKLHPRGNSLCAMLELRADVSHQPDSRLDWRLILIRETDYPLRARAFCLLFLSSSRKGRRHGGKTECTQPSSLT